MKKICLLLIAMNFIILLSSCFNRNAPDNSSESSVLGTMEYPSFSDTLNSSGVNIDGENKVEKKGEMRAVWFSFLDYTELLSCKEEGLYIEAVAKICSDIKNNGFNAIIFQVRPYSDSVYPSSIYPMSAIVSGSLDKKVSYDPLKIAIDEAHKAGLEFHAWINPMRAHTENEAKDLSDDYTFKAWYNDPNKKGTNIVFVENMSRWYYNPTIPEVRSFIASGAKEIVRNYDVDGIHIDDYFYVTTDEYFDKSAYTSYKQNGGELSLEDFRRDSVSKMVKELYDAVKSEKSDVVFGVSPGGNIENCRDSMYADVALWCREKGYADYICPQIYYSFAQDVLPFSEALEIWSSLEKHSDLKFYVGLAAYKAGGQNISYYTEKEKNDWIGNKDMLSRQISLSRPKEQYSGFFIFSYMDLFEPSSQFSDHIKDELDNIKELF